MYNAKYLKQMYPLVEEDFKLYVQNAKDVAFGDAHPNTDVIKRLKFSLSFLDKEKVDKIAKMYLLEHHLLTSRY